MFIVAKTIKGHEYVYSNKYSILCSNEKQANLLATHLNSHNDTAINDFKLKEDETWHVYEIDEYDSEPRYKLVCGKNKISIKERG